MEAGEYGLTRGTRLVAHCLEVVAVAGLMWVSWCFFGGEEFFVMIFFAIFFFLPTHTARRKYEVALPHISSLLVPGCVQGAII